MLNGNRVLAEAGPGVYTIDAAYVRPGLAAVHLVVDGGEAAFVDTAVAPSVPRFLDGLAEAGLAPADVRWVLVTHVHLDHAGGAGELMRRLPHAELVAHPRGAPHLIDPEKLVAGTKATYGEAVYNKLYGEIPPVDAARVRTVADGEVLPLGGRDLEFIHTPGHALHHYCIVDGAHRLVFSGDTFGVSYREFDTADGAFIFPTTTPTHFDPEQAHASIDRIVGYAPEAVYLTHYSRVTEVSRLAADLHAELDAFVEMAHHEPALPALTTALTAHLRKRLRAHGCVLPVRVQDELLALDAGLNAKGLLAWRQRTG
ncbi:MAG: MBL fold metallo-hydrolase [Xanthomonadaceae bacterium]|nr:MBL fold metallo-hydrolase [Xanthomonadaceae bacterium]